MKKSIAFLWTGIMGLGLWGAPAAQDHSETLYVVRFPERRSVEIDMTRSRQIPEAEMKAKVEFKEGQNRIEISYKRMKPAVLFAGDVTAYVLWAVNRDGGSENLGELWVRPDHPDDKLQFSTGLRTFALMVTAEPYYQVSKPSELVICKNEASRDPQAPSAELRFEDFAAAPEHGLRTLSNVKYDGQTPLDVIQAEKVLETALELGVQKYAPQIYAEADLSLRQARQMARSSRSRRGAQEFARKSVASSNEAIKITLRNLEAEELERRIADRQNQMAQLEERAAEAERQAQESQRQAQATQEEAQRLQRESQRTVTELERQKRQLESDKDRLERERTQAEADLARLEREQAEARRENAQLDAALAQMRGERTQLQEGMQRLRDEKEQMEGRLQGALSQVAETRETATGFIVNLPDILFDTNKADLKPEAKLVVAKLTGILLIMRDLQLRVEGHTDSTGTPEYNLGLSKERAASVYGFLASEGIETSRMTSIGFGLERPIADNSTAEGRRQNRRVEIVIDR